MHEEDKITLNAETFDVSSLSPNARAQVQHIRFVDEKILQKNNELQIADSARIVYTSVLKSTVTKKNEIN